MRRARIPYSAEEMAWLEQNYSLVISDYHAAFVARFARVDVSAAHLHSLRKRKGWKVGRAPGRYVGRVRTYSKAELTWLEQHRTMPIAEYFAAFQSNFDRPDVTAQKLHALRKRQGWKTGRSGQFEKGQRSWNKGAVCPHGEGGRHPNAQRTQFKKGARTGRASDLYQPIGTERVTRDGYLMRKIHDGLPMHRRWQLVQRIEWEKVNGPIPAGHALKCLDGNRQNTDPSNWEAVPRGVLARLNGGRHKRRLAFDQASPEVKPVLMAIAKLEDRATRLRSEHPVE